MKHIQTFEGFLNESQLNEGLSTTSFTKETVDKIWEAIKTLCISKSETASFDGLTLKKLTNSNSDKWNMVANNADKLQIGQISATSFSLLVMITEGATVKGYFEIAPYDTVKQKFKSNEVYVSVVNNDQLSMGKYRAHKKIVYQS